MKYFLQRVAFYLFTAFAAITFRAGQEAEPVESGVLAGWRRGSWTDGLLPVTTFFSSVPYFWLGIIAIYLLAGPGSFFPSSGGSTPAWCPR